MRWAAILAGGSGTRFWPLSTSARPKHLLPLAGPRSTAEEAVARLEGLIPKERILVVTGAALAPMLQRQLGLSAENVLVEPRAASTAPALVWASAEAARRDPEADVLSLHADWCVVEPDAFRHAADAALSVGRTSRRLVTVGIVPTRPETGYGYVVPGEVLQGEARTVGRFVEKPDASTARDLIAKGALWNSGLFAWPADLLLQEVSEKTPELAPALPALRAGRVDEFFRRVTPISIDVGVLERSARVAVVPGRFSWDDVGTWDALMRVRQRDPQGNVTSGPVHLEDTRNCVVWSDQDPIVVSGVQDLVIVHANHRVLVMTRDRAADLKTVLEKLPPDVREPKP
ncbi:MAG TPA: sugar phosphate nucleotidyltransferase [Gemmatimonadales bacterium]|jgi:mannose-1-phosphate guanylyltransferase|nr:sugar phosphate nucleotidyltransferase [Gemmatimonadales bacterium]